MKKILIITLALIMLLALPVIANAETEAYIPDDKMETALKEILNKSDDEILTPSELGSLTGTVDLSNKGIKNITGIQYLTGATAIDLSRNDIEKYSDKMGQLEQLLELDISFNKSGQTFPVDVTDIPNLETLNLAANKFTSISPSLSKMTSLKNLDLSANLLEDVPEVLLEMTFENLNLDYNFFDLAEGSADKAALDAMNVSDEFLTCRQLLKIPDITYTSQNNKIRIEWNEMQDIPFYDGTGGVISGYTIKVNGAVLTTVGADTHFYNLSAAAGKEYRISICPNYTIAGYDDFYISMFTTAGGFVVGYEGLELPEDTAPVMYANAYPTPMPEPMETPTPESSEVSPMKPEINMTAAPSAMPETDSNGMSPILIWIAGIIVAAIIIAVILILIMTLRKKKTRA